MSEYKNELLGLGGGIRSTECHSSYELLLQENDQIPCITSYNISGTTTTL